MKIKNITSISNPIVKEILNYKKNNLYLLSSQNIINEAIKNNFEIISLIVLEEKLNSVSDAIKNASKQILTVNDAIINKINPTKKFNYIFALVKKQSKVNELIIEEDIKNIVLLENIQNPENVGMIIRTTLGLGYQKILLLNCVNLNNDKLISSSSGAVFNQNVIELKNLDVIKKLKDQNFEIIITNLDNQSKDLLTIRESLLNKKKVLVFGNEGNGVSNEIKELATTSIKLNMENDINSFNVAVSSGIIGLLLIKKL